jgi:DNA-binding transcriptional LysR family regulator
LDGVMTGDWDDWRVVWAAGTAGTFTGAAGVLGMGQATVSRRIARLEEQLGQPLFARTPSGLVRTPAADAMWNHLESMHASWSAASAIATGAEAQASGVVRIATAIGIAVDWMPKLALALAKSHPLLQLEVLADNHAVDLERFEADIAIRSVPTERGDLLTRRLLTLSGGAFASRAYIEQLADNPCPQDLSWLQWAPSMAHISQAQWISAHNKGRIALTTNNYMVMRAAAQSGLGVLLCSSWEAEALGLLPVPVPGLPAASASVHLVLPRALRDVPRVAAVVHTLVDQASSLTG